MNSESAHNRNVSPPKKQRRAEELSGAAQRSGFFGHVSNSVKKKLQIEQENYNHANWQGFTVPNGKEVRCGTLAGLRERGMPRVLIALDDLHVDVLFEVLKFLQPIELIKNFQFVNRRFHRLCAETRLWAFLASRVPLTITERYLKQSCLVERRSKGKLYRAVSRVNRERVAVRKINVAVANAGQDDGIPTSILREISYLSSLDHPNLSKIIDVEVRNETVQIVSEFHEYNLKEYIKLATSKQVFSPFIEQAPMGGRPHLRTLKHVMFQLLQGISYLHHNGIIHRNLKVDNILVTPKAEVKVADFALSKLVAVPHVPYTPEDPKDRDRSGREARRLWCRAPELLLRKKYYSFEIDMWSLGCLFAEIALGEPLFNGDTEIEQLFKIFKLVGSPSPASWPSLSDCSEFRDFFPRWDGIIFAHCAYPEDSCEFQNLLHTLSPNRDSSLSKLKALAKVLGREGLDLLQSLLQIEPQKRLTAEKALMHSFFDEVRSEMSLKYFLNKTCNSSPHDMALYYSTECLPDCHLLSWLQKLKKEEGIKAANPNYLAMQEQVTEHMRCILVDWLIDVSVHFEVLDETLHHSISYIDRTLSYMKIDKAKLQLVGVTCMKIADVFNEKSKEYYKQENAHEYSYITADEYSPQEIVETEKQILSLLGFKLTAATSMSFLKLYCALLRVDDRVRIFAMFLVDLMLLSYQTLSFPNSLVASAALLIACKTLDYNMNGDVFNKNKIYLDFYTIAELEACANHIRSAWSSLRIAVEYVQFEAVYNKYLYAHALNARLSVPPILTQSDYRAWFYSK